MTVDEPLWEIVMKLSRVWESRTKTPNFELTWKQNDSVRDHGLVRVVEKGNCEYDFGPSICEGSSGTKSKKIKRGHRSS